MSVSKCMLINMLEAPRPWESQDQVGPVSEPPNRCTDAPKEAWTGAFCFGGIAWRGGLGGQLKEGEGEERDYCIADANEGTWGWSGRERRGRREGEEMIGTSGRGVKDNRKNLLVIKLQTDQIYIILYMYK